MLVTRNFPPLLGGMENVNYRLLRELAISRRVVLCGPAGCAALASGALDVSESPVKPLLRFFASVAIRSLHLASRYAPEIVIAGSGLSAPMAWAAARLSGARLVVYLHGLDIIAPSWLYQQFWLPFIRACDVVLVNSRNTGTLAMKMGVPSNRIEVLHPGTDMPILDRSSGELFRQRTSLNDRAILLSVGRLTRRKGLREFVERALPTIVDADSSVLLLVVGDEAIDALHSQPGSERERVLIAARKAGVESNVRFIGRCTDAELSSAYQAARVHVFPVLELKGDVEGFGMVALESAAHGLRTVAFEVGGVPDAVEDGVTGTLVRSGDYLAFASSVITTLRSGQGADDIEACREFAAKKSWVHFGERLRHLLGQKNAS